MLRRVAATPYPAYKTNSRTNRRPGKRSATGHFSPHSRVLPGGGYALPGLQNQQRHEP
ncbi:hypothetical protein LEJE111609_20485 [Lelliottia jeotgali]